MSTLTHRKVVGSPWLLNSQAPLWNAFGVILVNETMPKIRRLSAW